MANDGKDVRCTECLTKCLTKCERCGARRCEYDNCNDRHAAKCHGEPEASS